MSAVSLNVFINNIDCMVNKYNDTYHKAIKKTSLMLRQLHNDSDIKINNKDFRF